MPGDLAPSVQGLHSLNHCIRAQVHSHNTVVKTKKQTLTQQHNSVMEPRNVNALIALGPAALSCRTMLTVLYFPANRRRDLCRCAVRPDVWPALFISATSAGVTSQTSAALCRIWQIWGRALKAAALYLWNRRAGRGLHRSGNCEKCARAALRFAEAGHEGEGEGTTMDVRIGTGTAGMQQQDF